MNKKYTVYLYRSPSCIRGWLSYIKPGDPLQATVIARVSAETSAKAKNAAITQANKDLGSMDIISINKNHSLWGVNNFPDIKEKLMRFYDNE